MAQSMSAVPPPDAPSPVTSASDTSGSSAPGWTPTAPAPAPASSSKRPHDAAPETAPAREDFRGEEEEPAYKRPALPEPPKPSANFADRSKWKVVSTTRVAPSGSCPQLYFLLLYVFSVSTHRHSSCNWQFDDFVSIQARFDFLGSRKVNDI